MNTDKKIIESTGISAEEMERMEILMKVDENKSETFEFSTDGRIELKNEIADMYLESIDDPERKYELYYNVLNRLLTKYLPKGDRHKDARQLIYEEKNTFLTRGHRIKDNGTRGADSRMAYNSDIEEIINAVTAWITEKGTAFDLYCKLKELNNSKGY